MGDTPRKTSRHRGPSSFRIPSASQRQASNPHVSLIFAQGGSTLPSPDILSSTSRRPGNNTYLSEEALSRQLDSDQGGKQMGLRSRRSSSGTVPTPRTTSAVRSPSPSPSISVKEEDEADLAGPSALQLPTPPISVPNPGAISPERLNPKASNSWLRWTSPKPSFPKTAARVEKGKVRELEARADNGPSISIAPAANPHFPPQRDQSSHIDPPTQSSDTPDEPPPMPRPPDPDSPLDTTIPLLPMTASSSQKTENGGRGWQAFLWGSKAQGATMPQDAPVAASQATEPIDTEDGSPIPARAPPITSDPPAQEKSVSDANDIPTSEPSTLPSESAVPPNSSNVAWSSYIYSFIVPSKPPIPPTTSPPPGSHPVEPTSTTSDQKPVPAEPPAVFVEPASPGPPPTLAPVNEPPPSARKPSNTTSSGWVSYLALRSAQKQLANDTGSTKSSDTGIPGRKSVESGVEEVMDFSADPEFPSVPAPSAETKEGKASGPAKKVSQALAVRKERLSMSSTRSAGSMTPLSSSPNTQSVLDGKISSAPSSSKLPSSSSLPAPPQPAASQPSLAIPTFATTFDRPPRSLLPLPASSDTSQTLQGKGITAVTTGLAWKALSAVGGYVYGGGSQAAQPATEEGLVEDEKGLRGRKEGRGVGAELPRRMGLGGGSQDDGWKGVRRVVVVGVHGWFPAKMLNS